MKKSLLALSLLIAATGFAQSIPPVTEKVADTKKVTTIQEGSKGISAAGKDFYVLKGSQDKNVIVAYAGEKYADRIYALIDYTTKKELTPFVFESIAENFNNSNNVVAGLNDCYGLINNKGKIILPFVYDKFNDFKINNQSFYVAKRDDKYGVFGEAGETILPLAYDYIAVNYSMPTYLVIRKDRSWGIYSMATQKYVLPLEVEDVDYALTSYLKVKKNGAYSLFNLDGKQVFSKWYTFMQALDKSTILVEYEGKRGVIDISEKVIVPIEYEGLNNISYSKEGKHLFSAKKNGKWGTIQNDGTIVIPFEYSGLSHYSNFDVCDVVKGTKRGVLTMAGKVVIPVEYDEITGYGKLSRLKKGNKFGLIDNNYAAILPVEYDMIEPIDEEVLLICKNGKKGIIDKNGKVKIDCQYDDIITSKPNTYSSATVLPNPAIIVKNGKYGMVDPNGKTVIEPEYNSLQYLNGSLVIAVKDGKYGIRTIYDNKIVLPFDYTGISYKNNTGMAFGDKYIQFRATGKEIIIEGK